MSSQWMFKVEAGYAVMRNGQKIDEKLYTVNVWEDGHFSVDGKPHMNGKWWIEGGKVQMKPLSMAMPGIEGSVTQAYQLWLAKGMLSD